MGNILILAAILPVIVIVSYVYSKDQNREPQYLVKRVFWIGVAMAIPAVFLELFLESSYSAEFSHNLFGCFCAVYIGVGLVEEFGKWIVVKMICYRHKEFDEVYDAIVYAVVASLGFACIENIGYVLSNGLGVAFQRAILSVPGHACNGVLMGYFYGKAKMEFHQKNRFDEIKYLALSLLVPTFTHTVFDFLLYANGYFEVPIILFYLFVGSQYVLCFSLIHNISKKNKKLVSAPNEIHYCGKCGTSCESVYCTNCGYKNK